MDRSPIAVFFSYSREDKPLRDKLEIHLSSLKRQEVISSWHDRQILAGSEWKEEIDHHIQTADIILLLISPNFVSSEYCYDIELPDAMARHEAKEAYVVPILLRPVARWEKLPFAKLQVYPSGGKPVTRWSHEDDALEDVTEGIAAAVDQLLVQRREQEQELEAWLAKVALPLSPSVQPELAKWQRLTGLTDVGIASKVEAATIARQQQQDQVRLAEQRRREQADREKQEQERLRVEQLRRQQAEAEQRAKHQSFTIAISDRIPLEMIAIPNGKFWMGSPDGEGSDDEKPRHKVTIAPFFMSKTPITQAQYQALMNKNPSSFKGEKRPVEKVSWWDAIAFCEMLSKQCDRKITLPSEAQWEYACRAGTETPFYFGQTISTEQANHSFNKSSTSDVGIFPANKFGLYDMHGNVWEWCLDHWHGNYKGAPIDGSAWLTNDKNASRLLRGGSWFNYPDRCRSAYRARNSPDDLHNGISFRVVCV
jgi:formylglycine-generating enzyme required for sulfatase activity